MSSTYYYLFAPNRLRCASGEKANIWNKSVLSDLTLLIALASGEIAQGRGELRRRRLEDDRLCQPHLAFALILSGKDLKTPCGSHKHLQRQA